MMRIKLKRKRYTSVSVHTKWPLILERTSGSAGCHPSLRYFHNFEKGFQSGILKLSVTVQSSLGGICM